MLAEINALRARVDSPTPNISPQEAVLHTLDLLAQEVEARLRFESALSLYLNDAPYNPSSAATKLRMFLDADNLIERST